ncbi:hypothetical protein HHI36_011259 [Cryptolaemus montrouzieri]|uniref:Uncharacterized protein n=1 Tax=Cryptolaemus montrouzieri TaxID=559131 RepID=A0ABD2MLC5_9CUCU
MMFPLNEVFQIPASKKRPILSLKIPINKNCNTTVNESAIKIKKCLFGKCDPDDTLRLLDEQAEIDRKRIMERFGIDINDIEDIENENRCPTKKLKMSNEVSVRRSKENRKRKLLPSQGNSKITDFYRVKKTCFREKENKPQ